MRSNAGMATSGGTLAWLGPVILSAYTAYKDGTKCSRTSEYKIQTPVNHPKERIQHSKHDKSFKSRKVQTFSKNLPATSKF